MVNARRLLPHLCALLHISVVLFDSCDAGIHRLFSHICRHICMFDQRVFGHLEEGLHVLDVLGFLRHCSHPEFLPCGSRPAGQVAGYAALKLQEGADTGLNTGIRITLQMLPGASWPRVYTYVWAYVKDLLVM